MKINNLKAEEAGGIDEGRTGVGSLEMGGRN